MTRLLMLVLSLFLSFFAHAAPKVPTNADYERLEKRIEDLEKAQQESFLQANENTATVKPYLRHGILIGGFLDTAITNINGPDTKSQYTATSNFFGINLTAQMTPKDRIVTQILTSTGYSLLNQHNDPRATGSNPKTRGYASYARATQVNQAYYEHSFSEALNVQLGTGYVPFGNIFQQREIVLLKRRDGPQMLSAGNFVTSVGIAFPLWSGVHIHGSTPLGDNRYGYNLYTASPTTGPKMPGGGARTWMRLKELATFGLSYQIGDESSKTYQSYGTDADFKYGRYGLTTEFARTSVTKGGKNIKSYYVQPYVEFWGGKFLVYVMADYIENNTVLTQTSPTVITDAYKRWDTAVGINWLPLPTTRFRLGYVDHNYVGHNSVINTKDRDYFRVEASAGISF